MNTLSCRNVLCFSQPDLVIEIFCVACVRFQLVLENQDECRISAQVRIVSNVLVTMLVEVRVDPDLEFFGELVPQRIRRPTKAFVEELDDSSNRETGRGNTSAERSRKPQARSNRAKIPNKARLRLETREQTSSKVDPRNTCSPASKGVSATTPRHLTTVVGDKHGGKAIEIEVSLPKIVRM